jgi:hypothetical protein
MKCVLRVMAGFILLMGGVAWSVELDERSKAIVRDWAAERDEAASRFLRSWLRGEPDRARASTGLTIVAREAGIAAIVRDRDLDFLQRHSLLWGRRVSPETLPVVLLERLGLRFAPITLFAGRTFALRGRGSADSLKPPTFRMLVSVVQMRNGQESPLRSEEGFQSRDRGKLIREGLASGSVSRYSPDGLTFRARWVRGGGRLAGKSIKINGQERVVKADFADGWGLELPIVNGVGEIEVPKETIGPDSQVLISAPSALALSYPRGGHLWSASLDDWQRRSGLAMSELSQRAHKDCGGGGCQRTMFHFVVR